MFLADGRVKSLTGYWHLVQVLRKSFILLYVWSVVDSSQERSNLMFSLYSFLMCFSLFLH